MGGKRRKSDDDDDVEAEASASGWKKKTRTTEKEEKEKKEPLRPSMIKNKEKRSELHAKLKQQKKLDKRAKAKARDAALKRALDLGEEPPEKKVPRTIENTRELDETVCKPDDDELFAGNDADEFGSILNQQQTPKILITTCRFHSTRGPAFISELLSVIPNAHYFKRGTYDLKKLVLNNFTTRLGHRVGRLIQSLFPQDPEFKGRRVVTFHNQRDFIFFRHHRYIFETKEVKKTESKGKKDKEGKSENVPEQKTIARLQECGPRFTLKLISLQHGTFDTKGGEYEWVHKPEMDTSRRRFFL
ncbi:hypothetical protein AAZV13_16G014200 [Glycine max]